MVLPALRYLAVALALIAACPVGAVAQDAASSDAGTPPTKGGARSGGSPSPAAAELHKLPPDSTTKQVLDLPGRTIAFTVTAGSIRLFDDKGEPQADIAYTAYQLDGADRATRPVTFLFNGGPGAASAWLQLGNNGPWRLDINADRVTPSAAPDLKPNAETWLDFTDLVFIDPVGTGFSRFVATGDDVRKRFFSVDGDVAVNAVTIRRWLEKHGRLLSPKYVAAESYGGIRGPKLVRHLQTREGIGVKGLILISPVLDFREYSGSSILQYVSSLPTFAAVARAQKGGVTRADIEATNRLADKVASLTGIDQTTSRRLGGRFDIAEFRREFDRRDGKVTGRYDASVTGYDPFPDSSFHHFGDPSGDPLVAPLTSAAIDLVSRKLNWQPDGSYELLNGGVERAWDFGRGLSPLESITELRQILALDTKLRVLVAHGLFDLAAPYFGSKILLDQLPQTFASPERLKFVVYPGGHMFYSRDAARKAFRAEVEALMK